MSTKAKSETVVTESAGGVRSEPVRRAERPAGAAPRKDRAAGELREQLSDEVIDHVLAGARSEEIVRPAETASLENTATRNLLPIAAATAGTHSVDRG